MPPLAVMEYEPTPLVVVTAVLAIGFVANTASVSLFTKPVVVIVNDGLAAPYTLVILPAVTVNVAFVTVNVPSL